MKWFKWVDVRTNGTAFLVMTAPTERTNISVAIIQNKDLKDGSDEFKRNENKSPVFSKRTP